MINFNKHLKEILYEHDFIVLPRVGAFIADFRIDESGETPKPVKSFVFNRLLSADENKKFFNYILAKETVPLSDIEIQWNEYVSNMKSVTADNRLVEIPGIGHFLKDGELNFKFNEHINFYARDEFTKETTQVESEQIAKNEESNISTVDDSEVEMAPLVDENINDSIPPVEETINESFDTETIAEASNYSENQTIQSDSFLEEVYEEEENRRSFWWWLLPLLVILGAVATYWWINRDVGNMDQDTDYEESVFSDSTGIADSTFVDESFENISSDGESNEGTNSNIESNPEVTNTPKPQIKGAYHVWAGLFRERKNAEKLQQKLIRNDIPAEMQKVKNMRRIYVPVQTESEAQKMVKRIEQLTGDKAVYFKVD